jgi:hypothetical protein
LLKIQAPWGFDGNGAGLAAQNTEQELTPICAVSELSRVAEIPLDVGASYIQVFNNSGINDFYFGKILHVFHYCPAQLFSQR